MWVWRLAQPPKIRILEAHTYRPWEHQLICTWDGCTKCFTGKSNLTEHHAEHLNMKPFMYTKGVMVFPYSGSLFKHITCVHQGRSHFCQSQTVDMLVHRDCLERHMESMHSEKGMQRQKISEEKMAKYLPASVSTTCSTYWSITNRDPEDKSMLDFLIMFEWHHCGNDKSIDRTWPSEVKRLQMKWRIENVQRHRQLSVIH
jgi:hypothetical protein